LWTEDGERISPSPSDVPEEEQQKKHEKANFAMLVNQSSKLL